MGMVIFIPDRVNPWWPMLVESHCLQKRTKHLLDANKFAYELRNKIVLQLDRMVPNISFYPNHRYGPLVPFQR